MVKQHVGEESKQKLELSRTRSNRRKNSNYNRLFGCQIKALITVELWLWQCEIHNHIIATASRPNLQ